MGSLIDEKMESNETTPLIATVRVAPARQRYSHSVVRRFCTIALGSSLIALTVLFLLPVALLPDHHHRKFPHYRPQPQSIAFEELQAILLETPREEKAQEWSKYYTSGPHLAGKNYSQAVWTQERWEEWGIKSGIVAYDV